MGIPYRFHSNYEFISEGFSPGGSEVLEFQILGPVPANLEQRTVGTKFEKRSVLRLFPRFHVHRTLDKVLAMHTKDVTRMVVEEKVEKNGPCFICRYSIEDYC